MCRHRGIMTLEEYKRKIGDIKELAMQELEYDKDDEVFGVVPEFRDDYDLVSNGIMHKVFKRFDSVRRYIIEESSLMENDNDDEEPMLERAYWEVTRYRFSEGEYRMYARYCFSLKFELLALRYITWDGAEFLHDEEQLCHQYLLTSPKNVSLPYKTGDILKLNALPFGKDFYAVYGGESGKEKCDSYYQYCIYESEDRNGLWIGDISDSNFFDCVYFENSPLDRCELAERCPDEKLVKVSEILKNNPKIWYELLKNCIFETGGKAANLDKWIFTK